MKIPNFIFKRSHIPFSSTSLRSLEEQAIMEPRHVQLSANGIEFRSREVSACAM